MRRKLAIIAIGAFAVTVGLAENSPVRTTARKTVIFAGGCFWGLEAAFRQLNGVTDTMVGYTGGASENPRYEHRVDHLEACRVTYDPARVTYQRLVEYFVEIHDRKIVDRKSPY